MGLATVTQSSASVQILLSSNASAQTQTWMKAAPTGTCRGPKEPLECTCYTHSECTGGSVDQLLSEGHHYDSWSPAARAGWAFWIYQQTKNSHRDIGWKNGGQGQTCKEKYISMKVLSGS